MEFPKTIKWKGAVYSVPTQEELESMSANSVAETPDGEMVEPDHDDSWLVLLGIV